MWFPCADAQRLNDVGHPFFIRRTRVNKMHASKQLMRVVKTWKHDILAGSFAVLAIVLLLQLMSRGSAPVAAESPVAASPASFGISAETADAPDERARAGKISQRSEPQPLPDKDNREEATQSAKTSQEHANQKSSDSTPTESSATETESVQQLSEFAQDASAPPKNIEESLESKGEQLATADSSLKPNKIEEQPIPVEEMTAEDIAKAVEAYEAWVHNGDIRLVLEWALSPEQLNSVAALYVISTKYTTISVTPTGLVEDITSQGIPKGKLIGDLPLARNKWPSILVSRARDQLGRTYVAQNTNFILSDAMALKLYRTLVHEVGKDKSRPGSEFVLRLVTSGQQILVTLVRQN